MAVLDNTLSSQQIDDRTFVSADSAIAVSGPVASGVAAPANPLLNGGMARTTNAGAVTDGQMAKMVVDKVGRQVATLIGVRELYAQTNTVITNSAAETTLVAAGGAGVFNDLMLGIVSNTSATATQVDFRDAAAGTVRFTLWVPANTTVDVNPVTYITQTTANAAWTATCSSATSTVNIFTQVVKNI